jgi:hypothetical protein
MKLIKDLEKGIKPTNYYNKFRSPTPRKPKKVDKCKKFKCNPNKFFSKPLEDIELKCLDLHDHGDELISPFFSGDEDRTLQMSSTGKKAKLNQIINDLRIDTDEVMYTLESEAKKILDTNESNLISDISPKKNLSF